MNLLELRNRMKRKKPKFIRQDFHKKRLRKRWIKPRGLHSKVKQKKAGHQKKVLTGYGSPKGVRGLSRDGLIPVIVHNESELEGINKENEGIIIAKGVGTRNKISLLKKAKEKGIGVLNLNIDEYLKNKEAEIKKRSQKREEKKEKRKKEEKKEAKKEGKLEEKLSDDEKKEKEKLEKDKLLTKREV